MTAFEQRLRTAVVSRLMSTPVACLRRVAGINAFNSYAALLRFVRIEAIQLLKCPTVQTAFRFTFVNLGTLPNVGQVLQHNCATGGSMLHNTLAQYMVTISVETLRTLAQVLEMALCRLTTVRLQFSSQAETTAINFFPMLTTEKLTAGRFNPRSTPITLSVFSMFGSGTATTICKENLPRLEIKSAVHGR